MAVEANGSTSNKDKKDHQSNILQVHYGADLISDCVLTLKLSASTSALALTLYHRFYVHGRTAYEYSPVWISCAAILLAIKHDDVPSRRLSDVACAVCATLAVRESWKSATDDKLDYYGAAGYVWKASIMKAEHQILHSIGFRVEHELPHKLVLVFCNTLRSKSSNYSDGNRWDRLVRRAWAHANDIMRISACVTSRPDDVACACIARSSEHVDVGVRLPKDWMRVFGATHEGIQKVEGALDILYGAPQLRGRFEDLADADIRRACTT